MCILTYEHVPHTQRLHVPFVQDENMGFCGRDLILRVRQLKMILKFL